MIKQLLDVRTRVKAKISRENGAYDAFGRWIDRKDFADDDAAQDEEMREGVKGLLAYVVQSVEVKTMWPIFKSAIAERKQDGQDRWRVMQYRYDEVVLWVRDPRRVKKWAKHVRDLTAEHTEAHDLTTRLDVEHAPSHVDLE